MMTGSPNGGWDGEGGSHQRLTGLELAASEALANVVDHAYLPQTPGPANLHAWATIHPRTGTRRVVVTITDSGRWGRHHPAAPAPAARGHGLTIMRGCTEEMHIQHSGLAPPSS